MRSEQAGLTEAAENPNITWARLFVSELARGGLEAVCIAPGSRSTPLALAFYANQRIRLTRHLDERSAAYFALGMALESGKAVALVCTSGTAAANFLPAIIEAQMSQVPLLVMTADRPPELRHSGANQTIDQVKMFGDFVLWSVDFALPQRDAPDLALRNMRAMAARALACGDGIRKGPVHINFPFRKPLEPGNPLTWLADDIDDREAQPFARIEHGRIEPTAGQVKYLAELVTVQRRGIIVCGPRCPSGDFPAAVKQLSSAAGYPILADPLSGLRFGHASGHSEDAAAIVGGYETFLQHERSGALSPDLILRFGAVPTSKWLNIFLEQSQQANHIHITEHGQWADQNHTTDHFYQVDPALLCGRLSTNLTGQPDNSWQRAWRELEESTWGFIKRYTDEIAFDGAAVAALLREMPADAVLFAGNSLPIRHVDQFGQPQERIVRVYANRGASGIDGNISSGLGIAASSKGRAVLLLGDITFYHDSNGLLALKNAALHKVTIVLLNNQGGGIFRRLPIAAFEPPFEELFITAHGLNFAHLAALYGLKYERLVLETADDLASFSQTFHAAVNSDTATLLEVQSDGKQDAAIRQRIATEWQAQMGTAH